MTPSARLTTALATALVTTIGSGLGFLTAASGEALTPRAPTAPDTIVEVAGDRNHGFAIHHYDGSVDHPPTWSESRAECGEYHRRVQRVRCRTEVRVWFRDLEDMQQALDHAHGGSGRR